MKGQDFVEGRDTIGEMYKLWADASDLLIDTIKLKKAYLSAGRAYIIDPELREIVAELYHFLNFTYPTGGLNLLQEAPKFYEEMRKRHYAVLCRMSGIGETKNQDLEIILQ
ncbi:hypothetical protein J4480_04565 [Candidatus Woesearchaeota archaeon]|nr:hypothetical protein [Candidatus Woesearchaeota archaeon]